MIGAIRYNLRLLIHTFYKSPRNSTQFTGTARRGLIFTLDYYKFLWDKNLKTTNSGQQQNATWEKPPAPE